MTGDDIARLIYLGLILASVAGWVFLQSRNNFSQALQGAAVWGLIFVGVVAGYGLWSDISRDIAPRQAAVGDSRIEIPRDRDGHYNLTLLVNGAPVDFVVDTGASEIVLSRRDAARAGLDPDSLAYTGTAQTANGIVRTAPVRLDSIALGGILDNNLRAVVNEGALDSSLLGMTYLNRYSRIEIADGRMILIR